MHHDSYLAKVKAFAASGERKLLKAVSGGVGFVNVVILTRRGFSGGNV